MLTQSTEGCKILLLLLLAQSVVLTALKLPSWPRSAGRQGHATSWLYGMSGGAYINKPERRIRHLHDVLTSGPRTFDAVVVGAGKGRKRDRRRIHLTMVKRLKKLPVPQVSWVWQHAGPWLWKVSESSCWSRPKPLEPKQVRETVRLYTLVRKSSAFTEPHLSTTCMHPSNLCRKHTEALLGAPVGIYYTPGSLKAKLCIDGRQRLYEYCDSHNVPYSKLGKLLVAVHDDQIPKLKGFLANGKKNGMTDLEWLEGPAAKELEPDLNCVAAIRSPSTGVISSQKSACRPCYCIV